MAIPLDQILIQTVNGLVNGMILALVASGLTLIFGIMDVVNFAHGDLVMLGGFVGAATIATTGNFWLALLVAAVVIAVFGAVLQVDHAPAAHRPRPPHDHPRHLRHVARAPEVRASGSGARRPGRSRSRSPASSRSSTSQYPWYRILTAVLVRRHHRRALRSSCKLRASTASGSAPRPRTGSWPRPWASPCRSCTPRSSPSARRMAAASGVLFGPLGGVTQNMGFDFTLRAFIVVVVGRHGQSRGLHPRRPSSSACSRPMPSLIVSPAQAVIVSFVALILTLLFRPTGLFVPTPK